MTFTWEAALYIISTKLRHTNPLDSVLIAIKSQLLILQVDPIYKSVSAGNIYGQKTFAGTHLSSHKVSTGNL